MQLHTRNDDSNPLLGSTYHHSPAGLQLRKMKKELASSATAAAAIQGPNAIPLQGAAAQHAREQRQRSKQERNTQARASNPALNAEQAQETQRNKYTKQYKIATNVAIITPVDYP